MKSNICDKTTKRFDKLYVVGPYCYIEYKGRQKIAWYCDCDCGKKDVLIISDKLQPNRSCHCGCTLPYKVLTGLPYGKLIVVKLSEKKDSRRKYVRYWECQCECGNTRIVRGLDLERGRVKSCGCVGRPRGVLCHNWKGKEDISGQYWACINRNAKDRNLEFSITIEYIWGLFLKQERKCALTGIVLVFGEHGKGTASLDRIDSKKGYIEGNVQWVHKDVNKLKGKFTDKKLILLCLLITNYQYNKNNLI